MNILEFLPSKPKSSLRFRWSSSDLNLLPANTPTVFIPEWDMFVSAKSISRYLPMNGTDPPLLKYVSSSRSPCSACRFTSPRTSLFISFASLMQIVSQSDCTQYNGLIAVRPHNRPIRYCETGGHDNALQYDVLPDHGIRQYNRGFHYRTLFCHHTYEQD